MAAFSQQRKPLAPKAPMGMLRHPPSISGASVIALPPEQLLNSLPEAFS